MERRCPGCDRKILVDEHNKILSHDVSVTTAEFCEFSGTQFPSKDEDQNPAEGQFTRHGFRPASKGGGFEKW